jgi:hypothetical protein
MRSLVLALVVCLGGCGSSHPGTDDAARQIDAANVVDARPIDAPVSTHTGIEITPASGRLQGGNYTLDVQVGHPTSQAPATGGGKQLEGNAPIKP